MVVDDNLLLASLLQMMLEDEGYEARSAGDALDGYASFLRFRPEVVITDLHMPGGNGIELMNNIRREDPRVKTIYMSGDMLPFIPFLNEEKNRYPVRLLRKPFTREELLNLLAEFASGGKEESLLCCSQPPRMVK